MNGSPSANTFSSRNSSIFSSGGASRISSGASNTLGSVSGNPNYLSNVIRGNNADPGSLGAMFTISSRSPTPSFASEALKSRSTWEGAKAHAGIGQTSVATSSQTLEAAQQASSIVRTATSVGSGFHPALLAAQVAQEVGGAIASGYQQSETNQANKDYAQNIQLHTVGSRQSADAVRLSQQNKIDARATGATIGAMFGPIGALVGHFAGNLATENDNDRYKVDSFQGKVDPTDTAVAASLSTSATSGESLLQDNV